jgi:cobalt-zinc-cadmium efflux system membrane fusion protein
MKQLILLSYVMLFFISCSSKAEKTIDTVSKKKHVTNVTLNASQMKNAGIIMGELSEEVMGATITVTGSVEIPPQNKTAITFPFGGFVKSVAVLDGMTVKKGQALLSLEDPALIQLQQDYLAELSQLEFYKQDYDRQKSLGEKQVNSGKTVQQAKANYMHSLAVTKGLKLKLEMASISPTKVENGDLQRLVTIRAPFDGIITKMNAANGQYAAAQDVLLEIIDLKHCHIELFVFEKDIPSLVIGQKVTFQLNNQPEVKTATVYLIGREIGADRMVKVHCHLDNEDDKLLPGTFINATIELTQQKQLTVPNDAVVKLNEKDIVFTARSNDKRKNTFDIHPIEVLGNAHGRTAFRFVDEGQSTSKLFVLKGAYSILSSLLMEMEAEE